MVRRPSLRPASALLLAALLAGGPLAAPAAGVAIRPERGGGGEAIVGTVAREGDRSDDIALPIGTTVGWITVPRLGLERFPIHMGTGDEVLANAVGLYPGSERPGEDGNFATAGHRVTPVAGMWHGPYYDLDLLREGDELVLGYEGVTYRYRFRDSAVVRPTDVWVVDDDVADLTMTACHPKGSIAERIVAWWERIEPDADVPYREAASAARSG